MTTGAQSQHNADFPDRTSLVRSLDAIHSSNNTTSSSPTQATRASTKLVEKDKLNNTEKSENLRTLMNISTEENSNSTTESVKHLQLIQPSVASPEFSVENSRNREDAKYPPNTNKLNESTIDNVNKPKVNETEKEVQQPFAQSKVFSNNKSITVASSTTHFTKEILPTPSEKCNPIHKIIYIKTHKTGSTTMASIFERYGYRRNLMFALPKAKHVFPTTYFSKKGVIPIPKNLAKVHPGYDILDNHAVYNRPEMDKIVPNATYITIIRDPVSQLESAFGYFEMAKGMGVSNASNPFDKFMQNPYHYYNTTNYTMKLRSRNGQLFDLGLPAKLMNDTDAMQAKVDALDKEFDLVLITEYFDESLILMKKLLCWSFDDILYISNGIRSKSHRFTLSEDLKRRIRLWNAGDVLLYNHFNQTFWKKVHDYGPSFWTDLEEFRRLERKAVDKCVDSNKVDTKDRREDKFVISPKHPGKYCQDLLRADVEYTGLLKHKLIGVTNRVAAKKRNRQNERMKLILNKRTKKRGR